MENKSFFSKETRDIEMMPDQNKVASQITLEYKPRRSFRRTLGR